MKRAFTNVVASLLWASGLAAFGRRIFGVSGRFVLELHGVPRRRYSELPGPVRPSITQSDLEGILAWLSSRFAFLTPDEFLESEKAGVLLTFDDGFANNHDVVLPLLERHAAPAVFFVATQHLGAGGRWLGFVEERARAAWASLDGVPREYARDLYDGLNEEQLAVCCNHELITIGAHSVSHPRLTTLGDIRLAEEVRLSKRILDEMTGTAVDLFAYPYGDGDTRVARAVAEAGFRAAFVEKPLPIEPACMAIPRVGLYNSRPWYLAAKLSGFNDRIVTGRVLPT